MNRREFLVAGLASLAQTAGAMALPAVGAGGHRAPVVVHAICLRPDKFFWEDGLSFELIETATGPRLAHAGVTLGVGDALSVRLLGPSMGHYKIALYRGDLELRHFDSDVAGALLERGEPLSAIVSAVAGAMLRVDVFVDRAVDRGERIPLLDPAIAASGTDFHLLPGPTYMPLQAGWHPLRAEPWTLPHAPLVAVKTGGAEPYGEYTFQRISAAPRITPIPGNRRYLYNDSPWSDLDPATAVLTQDGRDVALRPYGVASEIEFLLLRGERIEGQLIKPGGLGKVRVDLSLVA